MTINRYEILVHIAETGSFTKAAKLLNITQPAASHAITSLETELGVPLIQRDRKKGILFTAVGQEVLVQMREILRRVENINQIAAAERGMQQGSITVGAFPSAAAHFMPRIMVYFRQHYPNLNLILHEGSIEEVRHWIRSRRVDVGIVFDPEEDMETVPLFTDQMVLVMREDDVLASRISIDIEDLGGRPMMICRGGYKAQIMELFRKRGTALNMVHSVYNIETVLNMIGEGMGISMLPQLSLTHLNPGLVIRHLQPEVSRELSMAVPSLKEASKAVHLFMETAQRLFQASPSVTSKG
ncbi:LysR family transcriptional regulator [Paenibacillus sp. JX-17]|uniref:LysR family transcriptional regulator n=1 Tax=Paenibacillus lacisoli TaxID=3064525 RepID=A0ABT9C8P7_9BACL|nr:LysR family transcriptional regulator [Paenibacillus sp. JX-17]MDO7905630.1 LysR family transcriptional regulator [Paenibacillus sp. JX-17]